MKLWWPLLFAGCDGSFSFLPPPEDLSPDLTVAADLAGADLAGADLVPGPVFVSARNGDLFLGAERFRFVGANRYDVNSFPPGSGKYYCGNAYSDADLDRSFSELVSSTGATVLRVWAFQSFTLGGTDFSMLDRAVATAKKYDLRLIFTLENEWKDCTQADPATADGRKGAGWFDSGYKAPLGNDLVSYRDYVLAVVGRYRDEPQIAMWQLMNEVESPDADALYNFAVDMAGVVKFADPNHLLSLGTIGTGQAGINGSNYQKLHMIGGIDVVEAHDYGAETSPIPGSPSSVQNSIFADIDDAALLGKPFFVGEAGIPAPSPYPFSYAQRAQYFDDKIAAHWAAGTDGFLIWSWYDLKTDNWMGWDFGPMDPLAAVLKKYQ